MILGINLGTTNSLIAGYFDGEIKVVPNCFGKDMTPSVVSVNENDKICIGENALQQKGTIINVISCLKRNTDEINKEYFLNNKKYKIDELLSYLIKELKRDVLRFIKEKNYSYKKDDIIAIISVPAYFNNKQKMIIRRACKLADLHIKEIISEPLSVAIMCDLHKEKENTKFVIFDLGGESFDMSILEIEHGIMEVRAVKCDNFVGGEDFTEILVKMFIEKCNIDIKKLEKRELKLIKKQAEKCKIDFFEKKAGRMICDIGKENAMCEIFFNEYEKACKDILLKMRKIIEKSFRNAKLKLTDIDDIILVGGGVKLPLIGKYIKKWFDREPSIKKNPEETIVCGTVLHGIMKEKKEAIKEVLFTEICSTSLGIEVGCVKKSLCMNEGDFLPIIEKNTLIPVSRVKKLYTTYDNQTNIKIKVLQGDSSVSKNNIFLGAMTIAVPPNKAGEECVNVTYTYDVNSVLEVEAVVQSTKEKKRMVIQRKENALTHEEIKNRLEKLSYLKFLPREDKKNKDVLCKGEILYEENTGEIRNKIEYEMQKFEGFLDKQDRMDIDKARRKFEKFLNGIENMEIC